VVPGRHNLIVLDSKTLIVTGLSMDERECGLLFPDDRSVPDDEVLLRRIPRWHVFHDENMGRVRPSSAAFEDDGDGDPMSVYLSGIIQSEKRTPDSVLAGHADYALAGLSAGLVRELQQTVHPDARDDTAHEVVCGSKTDRTRRNFAKRSHWVIPPATLL